MKIKITSALILFILGISIFIYPKITDKYYKEDIKKKETEYIKYTQQIPKEIPIINDTKKTNNNYNSYHNLKELLSILKTRNEEMYNNHQHDFIFNTNYEANDINLSNYGLNYNIFGYIELPSIGITLPIYFGASKYNMSLGAVHLTGTSYPIGGKNTNSVIAAHRGFRRTKMFRDIDKINIGDLMYIKNIEGTLTYKAVKTSVIDKKDISTLIIEDNKDMITIISCHPFPFNYQRYVVYFERV